MNIVVVDDEINALQVFLGEVISMWNVEYKFFRDDVSAICHHVSECHADAAFLDVNMPNINGIDLANRLLEIEPSLKIVFITGLLITEKDLPENIAECTVGFLYKPYNSDTLRKYLSLIGEKKRKIIAKMFHTFDCFVDRRIVDFSSAKAKELFALLIAYNGKTLTMNDAISQLWSNKDLDKSKVLYRDAVWRLRKTLNDIDIQCIVWDRAKLILDKSVIECDYWDYLITGKGDYSGEFCKAYDWSSDYLVQLEAVKNAKGGRRDS